MKWRILILALIAGTCYAQTVTVQATIQDSRGNLYQGGSGRAVLVSGNGSGQQQWLFNGTNPVRTPLVINNLDSFGHFSMPVTNTNLIAPGAAAPMWQFSFCSAPPPACSPQVCFTLPPQQFTTNTDFSSTVQTYAAPLPPSCSTGGGGGASNCPVGALNDVQLYGSAGHCNSDTGILIGDPVAHRLSDKILNATQEVDVSDATHPGLIDLGHSNGTGVDAHFLFGLSSTFNTAGGGYGISPPDNAPAGVGDALTVSSLTPVNGMLPTAWASSVTGLVSYQDLIPLWTTGCDSPLTCSILTATPMPWGQSMFYGGPPLGSENLPYVLTPTTAHDDTGTLSTITITYANPIEPGDTLIAQFSGVGASAFCNVQDAQGDVFTSPNFGTFYAKNVVGGFTTVTAEIRNLSCGGSPHAAIWQAMLSPVHGADKTNPIDAVSSDTTGCTGSKPDFTSLTTSTPDLIVALVSGSGSFAAGYSTYAAGVGYAMNGQIKYGPSGGISGSRSLAIESGPFSTPGTFTPSMLTDANCSTETIALAIKPASGTSSSIPSARIVNPDDIFPGTLGTQVSTTSGDTGIDLHVGFPINADGVTTAYSAAVLYTVGANNSSLVVDISVDCKTATATLVPSYSYTNVDSDVVTVTFPTVTCGTTTSYTSVSLPIRAKAGTDVTFSTASLTNSPTYNVHALVKQASTN